jgi:hypothetical protein
VAITFGTIGYDEILHEYSMPVQVQNISNRPIYGPVRVTVQQVIDPYDIEYHRVDPLNTFSIKNSSNGKTGAGAVFDFSRALGSLGVLEPGARSESVIWRVRTPVTTTPYIGVRVDAYVPNP